MNENQAYEASKPYGPKDRFTYVAKLPSLQEIASYQIVLAIRYSNVSQHWLDSNIYEFGDYEEPNYKEQIKNLKMTPIIEYMIRNCAENVEMNLRDWVCHLFHIMRTYVPSRHPYILSRVNINWCVWLANGEIDYLKTGRKMIETGKLSETQKFIFSCVYCMEDEIKKFSLDALPSTYIEGINYYNDKIMFYWICYLKNELFKVPLENHTSIEAAMVEGYSHNDRFTYPRFAIEHFWQRIGEENQFTVISEWISLHCLDHSDCTLAERLISTMSWPQQHRLLSQKSKDILPYFTVFSNSTECALWVWRFCKDTMSAEDFTKFVKDTLFEWNDRRYLSSALMEIWETAYDFQRNFVVQTEAERVILSGFHERHFTGIYLAIPFQFVLKFLQLVPMEDRREIILGYAAHIASRFGTSLNSLKIFLDAGLPCPDDVMTFKKLAIDSKETPFFRWIIQNCETFNRLLEFYFNEDADAIHEFKKNLFENMTTFDNLLQLAPICYVEEWKQFEKFIDGIFPHDPSLALKKKQWIVELMVASSKFRYWMGQSIDTYTTIEIVEMVFANANEELKSIKRVFAQSVEESAKTFDFWIDEERFNEMHFQRITQWCWGNDEKAILEFRNRVSRGIFYRIFHQIYEVYQEPNFETINWERLLKYLNKCLKWYLTCDDRVKIFKMGELNELSARLEIFETILIKRDGRFLEILLKWFFGDNDEQIRKFIMEKYEGVADGNYSSADQIFPPDD